MKGRIDLMIINPPLQRVLDVLNWLLKALLELTRSRTNMFCDRDIRKGSKVINRFGSHVEGWCDQVVVDLIVSDVCLSDKFPSILDPFLPFLLLEIIEFKTWMKD